MAAKSILLIEPDVSFREVLQVCLYELGGWRAKTNWFTPSQLQQMGFAGAVVKPFNPLTLAVKVSQLLKASRDRSAATLKVKPLI